MKCLLKFMPSAVGVFFFLMNFCPVAARADRILAILKKHKIDSSQVSMEIRADDRVVDSVNPKLLKTPASVSKLLTTYAILQKLPQGHRFRTELYYDNENLYLKGGGDPSFVSEKMWFLVNEFLRSNPGAIADVIVDDSIFDQIRFDSSRENIRVDRAYDSPVGGLSFNWNAINVFVRPGKANEKAMIYLDPESDYYELVNQTKTVSGALKKELVVSISGAQKLITVSGEVAAGAPEKAIYKSIDDPGMWSGYQLKSFLKQRGINVLGKVKRGTIPAQAALVAFSESKSLAEILADMNKFSNNFVAEMLTKGLASQGMKEASLKRGVEVIREELEKRNLSGKDFFIENPSGLTRNNRLSAFALNDVLLAMKKDFRMYSTVLESLPIGGIDGTLKKRLKNPVTLGWVRGKTGYLDGVVSLAGYAGRKNGEVYTYSFLYNGPRDEAIVREAFDQVLTSLLK